MGHDAALTMACACGSLELNPFLPLVAHCLLQTLDLLANACDVLRRHCVEGIEANEARCHTQVHNATAAATALIPALGYEQASDLARAAAAARRPLRALVLERNLMSGAEFDACVAPEAVCRLGAPGPRKNAPGTEGEGS